jgi:hypothetical protein
MNQHLAALATKRAALSPTGIGAYFDRNVTPRDLDGWRCRMVVADGAGAAQVDVNLAGSEHLYAYEIPVMALIRVTERRAGSFPVDSRLKSMALQKQIMLRSDDFRASDFEFNPEPMVTL